MDRIAAAARRVSSEYPHRLVTGHGWVGSGGVVVATHNPELPPDVRDQELDSLLVLVPDTGPVESGNYVWFMPRIAAMREY